ncbi:uncharacterized protein LOC124261764 [Haliotis rubra]|uniref:uncharacterized protein LOC124261764 n=1 Tax=Haliotis rubra TaxID=36100 RepID=UPI001EE61822|nr:uncharacterized protein LOC124261764 [Haliotis rubra]
MQDLTTQRQWQWTVSTFTHLPVNMMIFVLAVFLQAYLCLEGTKGTNGCTGSTGPDCKTTCSKYCVDRRCQLLPSGSTNCTLGCTAGRHGTSCTLECSHTCHHCQRYDGDVCRDPPSTDDPKDTGQDGSLNSRKLVIIIMSLVVFAGMCVVIIFLLVYRNCGARRPLLQKVERKNAVNGFTENSLPYHLASVAR